MLDVSLARTLGLGADRPAIETPGQSWSWQDVAAAKDGIDRALEACGVGEGGVVCLISRNRPSQVAALLSIPASRRCVSIVSGVQGSARIAEELERLRPAALVAGAEDLAAPEIAAAVRELELPALRLPVQPGGGVELVSRYRGGDARLPEVAAQILTSGTTGAPKRIPLRFDALQQAMEDLEGMLSEDGEEGPPGGRAPVLLFHPLANISGLYLAFYAGVFGRAMQLFERFRVEEWVAAVRRHRPRLLWLPPAAIAMVVEAGVPPEVLGGALAMRSGAAPLSDSLRARFEATYGIPILSHYGASEFGGIVAAVTRADHVRFAAARRGSVGRARPGVSLRIVDHKDGRPCPVGGTGLLQVRAPRMGSGWIGTTDLARIDADGFLFLEGRSDDAINRGGFKILPEQVADVLRTHDAVRDVVVVGLSDRRLGEVPAAAVVLRDGSEATGERELEAFARRRLLAYQVPARFLFVAELPRTGTMKIDRRRVLALFDQASEDGRA